MTTMKQTEAFSILAIPAGTVTPADIKLAYRKAAQRYHPDRNPAGEEMMTMINAAYASIENFQGQVPQAKGVARYTGVSDYSERMNKALNAIIHLKLRIEICGSWAWVSGQTQRYKRELKAAGFQWASKKGCWFFAEKQSSKSQRSESDKRWTMDDIRNLHGSTLIKESPPTAKELHAVTADTADFDDSHLSVGALSKGLLKQCLRGLARTLVRYA